MDLTVEQKQELEVVERFHTEIKKIDHEIRKIIVGQKEVVDQVMISMLTGGHSIITGVPGLAKTLLISTVAQVLHLGLDEGAQVTGRAVLEFDDAAGVAVEDDDVALADLRCWNSHCFISRAVRLSAVKNRGKRAFIQPYPRLFSRGRVPTFELSNQG